jgi:hypothetical protein
MSRTRRLACRFTALLTLLFAAAPSVHALANHTWVSGAGNDANACSQTMPCLTFAGALAKTNAGGEIDVLNTADYGPVTINKAISIVADGVVASIQVSSGNAITISAGSTDVIVLRGLTLDGMGTGLNGISFSAGGALHVESCTINNFGQYGIDFESAGPSTLVVQDTMARHHGSGTTGGACYIKGEPMASQLP